MQIENFDSETFWTFLLWGHPKVAPTIPKYTGRLPNPGPLEKQRTPRFSDAPETPRAKADGLGPRARARSALARGVSFSGRRIRFALFLTE